MNEQQKVAETLKDKKIESIFWTVIACLSMYVAASGCYYSKRDNDQAQKVLAVTGALSALVSGYGAGKSIKQYRDIKKEISQRAKENTK